LATAPLAATIYAADTPTLTWNGSSTNWKTAASWGDGLGTDFPSTSSSSSAIFDSTSFTAGSNLPNGAGQSFAGRGIWVDSGAPTDITLGGTATVTIVGDAVLNGQANAGIILTGNAARNLTISPNVAISNDTGFYIDSPSTLTLGVGKAMNLNGKTLTIGGTSAAGVAVISSWTTNAGSLIINTAGMLSLKNNNSQQTQGIQATLTSGTLDLSAGTTSRAFGSNSTTPGSLTINGGSLDNTNSADTGLPNATNGSSVGMTWNADFNYKGTGGGALNLGNGAVTLGNGTSVARTITVDAGNLGVNGVISNGTNGTNGLTKAGAGTLTLGAGNNLPVAAYTGATTVNAGSLVVNGSIAASSGVHVSSGATLAGTGILPAVSLATGGSLAPGDLIGTTAGTLSTGSLNLASGAKFRADLGGAAPGNYDQANVSGLVNLNDDLSGGSNLVVTLNYAPAAGDQLFVLLNDGVDPIAGEFNTLAEGASFTLVSSADGKPYGFTISYAGNGDGGAVGNDVVLSSIGLVPEPGSLAWLGVVSVLCRRRRHA